MTNTEMLVVSYDPETHRHMVELDGGYREATRDELRAHFSAIPSASGYGWCDNGMDVYFPGLPCTDCGRFVGRDGSIEVEHFEMSSEIASVEGTCARCIAKNAEARDA